MKNLSDAGFHIFIHIYLQKFTSSQTLKSQLYDHLIVIFNVWTLIIKDIDTEHWTWFNYELRKNSIGMTVEVSLWLPGPKSRLSQHFNEPRPKKERKKLTCGIAKENS